MTLNIRKAPKIIAAALIILAIGYFYSLEVRRNWASLQNFEVKINAIYLIIAMCFYLLSYLSETFIWQVCMNNYLGGRRLNFPQSVAVVNSSGLLKYLPGRIWTYAAQLVWLKKYNISKSAILYVNLICILGSVIVSLYLGLIYLAFYTDFMTGRTIVFIFVILILFNFAYIAWNSFLMNKLIALAGRLVRKEIQLLSDSKSLSAFIQLIYMISWSLMGFGGYFLAGGIGLNIQYDETAAILASMSISWLTGYIAVISPGGLGIREGMMLVMLNGIVETRIALIFPLLSRFMSLIAEALLGIAAFLFGIKYNVFSNTKTTFK